MADESPSSQSTTSQAVRWLLGQEANTIVLFAVLGAVGWSGWYGITTAIPKHLDQIQTGYQSVAKQSDAAVKDLTEKHTKQVESISKSFDTTNERNDNLLREVLEMKRATKVKEVGTNP